MSNNRPVFQRCRYGVVILAVLVLLQMLLPLPVFAQEQKGSLRLNCHVSIDNRKIPLAGDTYAIVKVADVDVQTGNLPQLHYETEKDFAQFSYNWADLADEERREAAQTLADYAEKNSGLLTKVETTDANGTLMFSPLEAGMYLVVRTQVALANRACIIDPFLVSIPTIVNGNLEYDLTSVPKVEYQSITIRPSNVTIYMGGNDGYDAVDGEDTNSLPKPMFEIDAPDGVDVEELTILYHEDPSSTDSPEKLLEWKPVFIGNDEEGKPCYRLDRTDGTNENFHIQYYVGNTPIYGDYFQPRLEHELYKLYKTQIPLNDDELLVAYVTDVDGTVFYPINRGMAELTVRAVERESIVGNTTNPVTRVFSQNEAIPEAPSKVGIVAVPDGTTYTLNNTNIRLEDLHGSDTDMRVGLLFDDIINDVFDRQAELEKQADLRMPALEPGAVRHFQSQYLDLVDMNNGNAWVKASKDVEVYWGYPEGTDQNTDFTLWHFGGLHRDGTDDPSESGYDLEDIQAVEPEKMSIENTPQGIRFTVHPGGFSPFVLVWEERPEDTIPPDSPSENPPESEPEKPIAEDEEDGNPIRIPFLPQTGDNTPIGLLIVVLIVSASGFVAVSLYRKKHKD